MNFTFWLMGFWGINLLLQIAVMYFGVQCDKRHDRCTVIGTTERARSKWWEGVLTGTMAMFIIGFALWLITIIAFAIEVGPQYNRETEAKCKTIEGEFSRRLDACYKNGVKINFNDGEMTYGE